MVPPAEYAIKSKVFRSARQLSKVAVQNVNRIGGHDGAYVLVLKDEISTICELRDRSITQENLVNSKCNIEDIHWNKIDELSQAESVLVPYYGTDITGTLFPDDCKYWNLSEFTASESIIHEVNDFLRFSNILRIF